MAKKNLSEKEKLIEIYAHLYSHFGPQQWWPGDTPFEIAVGAILTQNTNWVNVEKAINNLKQRKCLNANRLHKMSHKKLASLIRPAGYFNIKANRLKNFLDFLATNYKSSMHRMKSEDTNVLRERLLDVNGIGPETADSILLYALDKTVFVIDAYTKRVLTRHTIAPESWGYHELQSIFHNNLAPDLQLFNEFHALFVMVGKDYCKPQPRCSGCPLNEIYITSTI
jgi:endonuclease-3 related protein